MRISVIIPVYNEEGSLVTLYDELSDVLTTSGAAETHEIIFINDGSRDSSAQILNALAKKHKEVKVIHFTRNFGQTAALSAGIEVAQGEILVPLDADLQNDPHDIPDLVKKIEEGFDVVSGWRKDRKDVFWSRQIPSRIANRLVSMFTGVVLHDYGCTLKAYRREYLQGVTLYGEMHRFIPAYIAWSGGRVTEVVVHHRSRVHGTTKYGLSRTFKVLLDLVVLKFLFRYMNRPMHFFGSVGFVSLGVGILAGALALIFKFIGYKTIIETPLPIFSALFVIVGVQLVVMGIIGEILMRTYYESQNKTPFVVREKINLG